MGFMNFDGIRYWDVRDSPKYDVQPVPLENALASDCRCRIDSIALFSGDTE